MCLNLIVNKIDIEFLISKDSIIRMIYEKYGTPPNWQQKPGFETLSKIILGQQLSLESAAAHYKKLKSFLIDFTPENVLKLSDSEMRSCFISRQKTAYLRALAVSVLQKELVFDDLKKFEPIQTKQKLMFVKGIGEWTADVYRMFCLQHKNVFLKGDIAILNTVKELYGLSQSHEIAMLSERWNPFNSLGCYFIWHFYLSKRGKSSLF